jgi:quinoprotein glucose dehydrogenase
MKQSSFAVSIFFALILSGTPRGQQPTDQWPNYQNNSDFSPLTQITPANVQNLVPAWTFNYGAGSSNAGFVGLDYRFEVQPLLIGGVMYISTPASQTDPDLTSTVTALEPETGKVIWRYISPKRIHGRGLAYWPGNRSVGPRLYFGTDLGYLRALDLKTGQPAEGFGDKGEIDVYLDVASPEVGETRRRTYTVPNPVAIYKNLLIAGARPGELGPPQPRGDIRAWDTVTGKLVWDFHVIPQQGEANFGTWPANVLKDRSGANSWSTLTVDDQRGLVFAGLGDANRPGPEGMNLYTGSLVALDANTGKLKWFHQLIHHDIWDFDLPTPALLIDVRRNGRVIPAVLQTGKMGLVFIFNRETGEPLYGMEERKVPQSEIPGTFTWPTQPFPVKPGPIGRLGITVKDINKITPEVERFCTDFWNSNHLQPSEAFQVPLSNAPTVTFPSPVGGPNWGPLSYNPQLGYVFINLHNSGVYRAAGAAARGAGGDDQPPGAQQGGRARGGQPGGGGPNGRVGGPFSYVLKNGATIPCWAPPYGELVALDVNKGEIVGCDAWDSESLAELGDAAVKFGTRNIGGSIATPAAWCSSAPPMTQVQSFDAKSGAELWTAKLPASAHSTPVTYMGKDGVQYVGVAAGGGTAIGGGLPTSDSLVAFRLGTAASQ